MKQTEQTLTDLIKLGQSGAYKHFVRQFTARIRNLIKLKNPLSGQILVSDIDTILEIINPELSKEIKWLQLIKSAVKLWCNEIISTNRILGIKNDNEYDEREFEKAILQMFSLKETPHPNTIIQTNFKTLIELVELGKRRFQY